MRLVLDTNIPVSAALKDNSTPAPAVRLPSADNTARFGEPPTFAPKHARILPRMAY
jgi:hypothetical protein